MLVAALAIALAAGHASGCGIEGDNVVLQRSILNATYPDSLYVAGAVSSARLSGKIDRWLGLDAPTTPVEIRMAMLRVSGTLWKLRARLATVVPADAPVLSIVLLEPVFWSRLTTEDGALKIAVHIDGPARSDVVAVTDEPVIAAINSGKLAARDALSLGLLRLYGSASEVKTVRAWLQASAPAARVAQREDRKGRAER